MGNEALNQLGALPGMANVKEQVAQIIQFKKISKLRSQNGLKASSQSLHMVFTGSPGTGKTTAARLIGEAFASLGILKGHRNSENDSLPFVEVHHADVTSPLVGEAEKNIKKKFKKARGGVLFIDEAYAFLDGGSTHKTDDKVVTAILQLMEDMRDEVMVIIAGYPEETEQFLDSNPGLRSRFANTIHFPDYSVPDLIHIAQTMLKELEYKADPDFLEILANQLWVEKDEKGFGNARTVRNILEQSIRRHSVRVAEIFSPSVDDLTLLKGVDIQTGSTKMLTEKDLLLKALNQIKQKLLVYEIKELSVRKSTVE